MKKNLVLMTALFAGSMIVNDGFGGRWNGPRRNVHTTLRDPVQVVVPNNDTQRDEEQEDEELPADREQEEEKMRNLQTQLTETQNKLGSTQKELESAQKAKEELESKVKELEESLEDSKEKIQAQLSEKEKELQELQKQLKEQSATLQKAQSQLNEKKNDLEKLKSEKQSLESQCTTLVTQIEGLRKSYSGLEDERNKLTTQVNSIKKQLNSINSMFEENVLGKDVTQNLQLGTEDDGLGRQLKILNAYVNALQGLHTNDGTKKEMSKEDQENIDKFIAELHTLNKNVGTYTQYEPKENDKKGIEGIRFEINQLYTNIATLLESYKGLSDKLSQITARASVKVKKEQTHSADETQLRCEEFSTQNKKSYWIPGWVKTIGVGVGVVVLTVLAKQYQNYSVTVPATPGTNSLSTYRINYNNAAHDVIWNTSTGSMRYLNGTEYEFGELDIDRLNEAYPEPFKQYLNESQTSAESQWTSWFSWLQTDNKQNEDESCKNYYEEGKKNGTKTMQKELEELKTQNNKLQENNTDLQTKLETSKIEKTTAEQKAEEAKKNLDKCNTKKDQLIDSASFLTQQLGECTNDKTKANKDLKQCNADKAEMYTQEEYDAHYNEGLNRGKDEKKCPNTGSTISEEDQEILRRYKEREERIKKLNEEIKASSIFSFQSKYLWEKIKLRFFYF